MIAAGLLHPEAGGDAYDIDKDGDLDILLNAGPIKASSGPG